LSLAFLLIDLLLPGYYEDAGLNIPWFVSWPSATATRDTYQQGLAGISLHLSLGFSRLISCLVVAEGNGLNIP
jgi:hypothetical protein